MLRAGEIRADATRSGRRRRRGVRAADRKTARGLYGGVGRASSAPVEPRLPDHCDEFVGGGLEVFAATANSSDALAELGQLFPGALRLETLPGREAHVVARLVDVADEAKRARAGHGALAQVTNAVHSWTNASSSPVFTIQVPLVYARIWSRRSKICSRSIRTWSLDGTAFALCTRSSSLSIRANTSTARSLATPRPGLQGRSRNDGVG